MKKHEHEDGELDHTEENEYNKISASKIKPKLCKRFIIIFPKSAFFNCSFLFVCCNIHIDSKRLSYKNMPIKTYDCHSVSIFRQILFFVVVEWVICILININNCLFCYKLQFP